MSAPPDDSPLTAALRAIPLPPPDARFVADVQARIGPPRPRRARTAVVLAAAGALALGATTLLIATQSPDPSGFQARGGDPNASVPVEVAVYLHPAGGGPRAPIAADPVVQRGFGLSFRAIRHAPQPTRLMIVLRDAAGTLHWAVPAWDDPAADPVGLVLDPNAPVVDLPSGLQPDAAPGPCTLIVLTTRADAALGVHAIEARLARMADPARALGDLPGAHIATTSLRVAP